MKLCRIINRESKETSKDATHPVQASKAQEVRARVPAVANRVARADNDPASKDSRVRAAADHNRKAIGRPG